MTSGLLTDPLFVLIGAQMNGQMDMNGGSGMMGTGMTLFMVLVAILVVLGIVALVRSFSHGAR